MTNLLPDKTKQWLGVLLSLLVGVLLYMAEWQDMSPEFHTWALRGASLTTLVSVAFGIQITRAKASKASDE